MKKVAFSYYVHKSNLIELFKVLSFEDIEFIKNCILIAINNLNLVFDIIKYDSKRDTVSLIECSTFDILNEPIVGDSYCFHKDLSYKFIRGGIKVYHHKWSFVGENYRGFDIEKSKERSRLIESIVDIKQLKSKIGNKDFWYAFLKKNNLEI